MAKTNLTAQRLREILQYDPDTGTFIRLRTGNGGRVKIGAVLGSVQPDGRLLIGIDGARYRPHRLAWLYVVGEWPSGEIDHINGDHLDNRFANLRDVSKSVNMQNQRRANVDSRTGLLGATATRSGKRFCAQIGGPHKRYLGTFDTPEEAHAAYIDAKRLFHDGCTI